MALDETHEHAVHRSKASTPKCLHCLPGLSHCETQPETQTNQIEGYNAQSERGDP